MSIRVSVRSLVCCVLRVLWVARFSMFDESECFCVASMCVSLGVRESGTSCARVFCYSRLLSVRRLGVAWVLASGSVSVFSDFTVMS